jgi:NTP pyrophosphatase (non-canonical NTP hydrolase)
MGDGVTMTLDEFQKAALRTINPALNERDRLLDAAMGLSEEAAELLGLVRKQVFQSRDVSREKLIEELGDALWCLAITADSLGISIDDVARSNVEKLQRRHPRGFSSRTADDWSRRSTE